MVLQDGPENFLDEDVFFDVGGDSVRSQKLIIAAEKRGIRLTMEQISLNASLEEMAGVAKVVPVKLQKRDADDAPKAFALLQDLGYGTLQDILDTVSSQCRLSTDQIADVYPCSPMQESLVAQLDVSLTYMSGNWSFGLHKAPHWMYSSRHGSEQYKPILFSARGFALLPVSGDICRR